MYAEKRFAVDKWNEGWPVRLTGKPATEGIGEVAAATTAKWRSRRGPRKTKERKNGGKGG